MSVSHVPPVAGQLMDRSHVAKVVARINQLASGEVAAEVERRAAGGVGRARSRSRSPNPSTGSLALPRCREVVSMS
jgi:hypothetical protein